MSVSELVPPATHDPLAYVEESPTPWHAVAETVERLERAGWVRVFEEDAD